MNDNMKTLVINTMTERKYIELSGSGRISNKQLHIVDNDDSGRTAIASYDILTQKIKDSRLSLSYDTIDDVKYIRLIDKDGNECSRIDASDFIKDGVLNGIDYIVEDSEGGLRFTIKKDDQEITKQIIFVDSELLSTSMNAIQNGAVYAGLELVEARANEYTDSEIEKLSVDALYQKKADSETSAAALDERISNIEQDYLKTADKTELQNKIGEKANLSTLTEIAECLSIYAENMASAAVSSSNEYSDGISGEIRADLDELSGTVTAICSDYALGSDVSSKAELSEEFGKYYLKTATSSSTELSDEFKKYQLSGDYLSVYTFETTISTKADVSALNLSVETLSEMIDAKAISISDKTTTEGYLKSYTISQGETPIGVIDIPKDFLVKSGDVKTCEIEDNPVPGYKIGDKYLDFVVNVLSGAVEDQHIYINVKDLTDVYQGTDGTEISVYVDSNNHIGAAIQSKAVTKDKIADAVYEDISAVASSYATSCINELNVNNITGSASKTVSKITESGGIVGAEFVDISISQNQVDGLADEFKKYQLSGDYVKKDGDTDIGPLALSGDLSVNIAQNIKIGESDLCSIIDNAKKDVINCVWSALSTYTVKDEQIKMADQLSVDDIMNAFHDLAMNLNTLWQSMNV